MYKIFVGMLILCLAVSGCFWPTRKVRPPAESLQGVSVEVLRPDLLARGGAVFVEPFKAGPEAEATPLLDRLALSIVQGAAEALNQPDDRLSYKDPNGSGMADFIIEGHIDQFKTPGAMAKLLFKKEAVIRIKGDVRDIHSQEIVALIYDQRKMVNDPKILQSAAYGMGADIIKALIK